MEGRDPVLQPPEYQLLPDPYFGMGAVPFPSFSESGKREDGLWCLGCALTLKRYRHGRLPEDVLAALVPLVSTLEPVLAGPLSNRVLTSLTERAYSQAGLLERIKHCWGAHILVPESALGNSDEE